MRCGVASSTGFFNKKSSLVHNFVFLGTDQDSDQTAKSTLLIEFSKQLKDCILYSGLATPSNEKSLLEYVDVAEHDTFKFKNKFAYFTGYGNEYLLTKAIADIEKIEQKVDSPSQLIFNFLGFSRGAITVLRLANRLKIFYPTISINIFAIDPVAGVGCENDWDATIIPSNVDEIICIYMRHEARFGFEPQDISKLRLQDPNKTKLSIHPWPGKHTSAQSITEAPASEADPEYYKSVTALCAYNLHHFLKRHGALFKDGLIKLPYEKKGEFSDFNYLEELATPEQRLVIFEEMQTKMGAQAYKFNAHTPFGKNYPRHFVSSSELSKYVLYPSIFISQQHQEDFSVAYPEVYNWYFGKRDANKILKTIQDVSFFISRLSPLRNKDNAFINLLKRISDYIKQLGKKTEWVPHWKQEGIIITKLHIIFRDLSENSNVTSEELIRDFVRFQMSNKPLSEKLLNYSLQEQLEDIATQLCQLQKEINSEFKHADQPKKRKQEKVFMLDQAIAGLNSFKKHLKENEVIKSEDELRLRIYTLLRGLLRNSLNVIDTHGNRKIENLIAAILLEFQLCPDEDGTYTSLNQRLQFIQAVEKFTSYQVLIQKLATISTSWSASLTFGFLTSPAIATIKKVLEFIKSEEPSNWHRKLFFLYHTGKGPLADLMGCDDINQESRLAIKNLLDSLQCETKQWLELSKPAIAQSHQH